jgi:hypothetical protein
MVSRPNEVITTGRRAAPKKDATCWEKAHASALANLNDSISDWNIRDGAVDKENFKSTCWQPKKVRGERHFELKIKVSGSNAILEVDADGNPRRSHVVPHHEVLSTLETWKAEVEAMTPNSSDVTAKSIHQVGITVAKPKSKETTKTYDKATDKYI